MVHYWLHYENFDSNESSENMFLDPTPGIIKRFWYLCIIKFYGLYWKEIFQKLDISHVFLKLQKKKSVCDYVNFPEIVFYAENCTTT